MSERVNQLVNHVGEYFNNAYRSNLLPYLLAKRRRNYYRLSLAQTNEGNEILDELTRNYFIELNVSVAEYGIYNWYGESPDICILYKSFMADEHELYQGLSSFDRCDQESFLKKRYSLRFFCIEIPLSSTQSIHLYQYISGVYNTNWKLHWNILDLFEDRERIQIIDYTKGFTIKQEFDFCSYYDVTDPSQCFSLINTRKWFEKMYGYIEKYREAYEEISSLDYIDLSVIETGTEDTWRKCHSLLRFPNLKRCLAAFTDELLSGEQTLSKDVLDEKDIPYVIRNDIPIVQPQTIYQAKIIIKMLSDGLVETQYLRRRGLTDYIDVI